MLRTEFATLTTNELIQYALFGENRSMLEIELAQRLDVLLSTLDEQELAHLWEVEEGTEDMLGAC